MKILSYLKKTDEKGATAIIVAVLLLFVLIPIGALAIDLALFYVARNQLQNAADAGALAGARVLYTEDGKAINTGANAVALAAATENLSMNTVVEVAESDVQRGHWSFGLGSSARGFYPSSSTVVIDLAAYAGLEVQLDEMDGTSGNPFINAVRVVARRETTPVTTYFSRIFGFHDRIMVAEAVGYLGYAGSLPPGEDGAEYPIAICVESLLKAGGGLECNISRMLEDNVAGDTAMWSNMSTTDCNASTTSIRPILEPCGGGVSQTIHIGDSIGTTNGVVDALFEHPEQASIGDCWRRSSNSNKQFNDDCTVSGSGDSRPTEPWKMQLPVINCTDGGSCKDVQGVVNVEVLWVLRDSNKVDEDAPCEMADWTYLTDTSTECNYYKNRIGDKSSDDFKRWGSGNVEYIIGMARWDCFVDHFNMKDPLGNPAEFAKKTIYFAPDCSEGGRTGITGPDNFGIMALIPVLVN